MLIKADGTSSRGPRIETIRLADAMALSSSSSTPMTRCIVRSSGASPLLFMFCLHRRRTPAIALI